jgi:hypothetical protein
MGVLKGTTDHGLLTRNNSPLIEECLSETDGMFCMGEPVYLFENVASRLNPAYAVIFLFVNPIFILPILILCYLLFV